MSPMLTGWYPRLLVTSACVQLVVNMVRPIVTYQSLAMGASTAQLGLVVASFSVLSLAAAIPTGRGIDRRGERGYLIAGTVVLALAVVLLARAPALRVVAIGSAALGLGQLITMIAAQTIIANGRDALRRDQRFATFTVVTSCAQFAAPAVAGLLIVGGAGTDASDVDVAPVYVLTFAVASLGLAAAGTLLWRPGVLSARPQHFGEPAPGAMGRVLRVRSVLVALVVGFAALSASDLLVAFMPAYGALHGLSPRLVGFLIAAHGLASIVVRLFLLILLRRYTRRSLLTVCLVMAAVSLTAVAFVERIPALFLLMLTSGAGIGLCQPIAIGWVASAVPPEVRGTAMSIRMAGNRLGQTVVPLGVASLAGAAGVAAAFAGPAALLFVAAGLVFWSRADEAGHTADGRL